ncbi:YqkE family protein [Paenibacillus tarimensis]|uniref:YqkE family protein n=1 Tax=Paenibacillus tarimensis TaxID=416012 RepID=UPI001F3B7FF9|nr:YqkE family protein [Paenibacillus tarimensis]MCF2942899.1 YqkE family protein [Paenibacillus tarimensis]
MAKKKQAAGSQRPSGDKPATLKDLLSADTINQLKVQAERLQEQAEHKKQEALKAAEEARKAEQKRLENDFEYLLNNSKMDWKSHK